MKDLEADAAALSQLVRSVQNVILDTAAEFDNSQLSKPAAVQALKDVEDSLTNCQQLVEKQAAKGIIIKFFAAGDYQAELKTATTNMANKLQVLQMALGLEQHADLKQQFEQLRQSLVAMKLETLRSMEDQATKIRNTVEQRMATGGAASQQDDKRLRRLLLECLEQAGVGGGGVAAGKGRVFTQEDIDNAVREIRREIEERGQSRMEAQEANFLAQIAEILKPPPSVPQNFLCPITLEIMRDPVILVEGGHSFERAAIERHFATSRTNPVTNLPLASRTLVPNHCVRGLIEEWLQHNRLSADQADNLPQQPPPQSRPRPTPQSQPRPPPAAVKQCMAGPTSDLIWAGAQATVLQGHTEGVISVSWSPHGRSLASGSLDKSIRIWDVDTARCKNTLQGHTEGVISVSWSSDGRSLASGSRDDTIRIWDVDTARCKNTLQGHESSVFSVSWSPHGRSLASGSDDGSIRIWDVDTARCKNTLKGHTWGVLSVSWSPDSRSLASGSGDKSIRIWDVDTARCKNTLQGHTHWVYSVSWSPDGRSLASGSADKAIRIWDVATAQCKNTLQDHTDGVRSVSWSPDGRSLASGSGDESIRIWDVDTARCNATLQGHTSYVFSVSWSPDGRSLASGSSDETIRIWKPCSRS